MKRTILAGFMVFGLSVLIAGVGSMGSVFAGEDTPVYGYSQYGEPVDLGFIPHADPSKHGVTMPGAASEIEIMERFWSQSEAGVSTEFWGPVEVGTLPGAERGSRLVDTGVDPARWAEPQAE